MVEMPRPRCVRCGAPATAEIGGRECDACASWPPGLPAADSAVLHTSPADRVVAGLKYRGWTALVPLMARRMAGPAGRLAGGRPITLVPVPLTPRRQRSRGFNQAELLARELGRRVGWDVRLLLSRRGEARRQAASGRRERSDNVRDAFRRREGSEARTQVLLVDDVLTTGATAAACGAELARTGVDCIGVVTFARALARPDEED